MISRKRVKPADSHSSSSDFTQPQRNFVVRNLQYYDKILALFLIAGFHLYFRSTTAIVLIPVTHGINFTFNMLLNNKRAKERIGEKNIKDLIELINFLNPVACESLKRDINAVIGIPTGSLEATQCFPLDRLWCDFSKVAALTIAETHSTLGDAFYGSAKNKSDANQSPPILFATGRKFINFFIRLILVNYPLKSHFVNYPYFCYFIANFTANCINDLLKFEKEPTIYKMGSIETNPRHGAFCTAGIKAFLSCIAKCVMKKYLEPYKECNKQFESYYCSITAISVFVAHDIIRDSIYLAIKRFFKQSEPKQTHVEVLTNGNGHTNGHTNGHRKYYTNGNGCSGQRSCY